MSPWKRLAVILGLLAAPFTLMAQNSTPKTAALDGEYFESAVRPTQSLQCFSCHGLDQPKRSTWFEFTPQRPLGVAAGELDERAAPLSANAM